MSRCHKNAMTRCPMSKCTRTVNNDDDSDEGNDSDDDDDDKSIDGCG